MLSHRHPEVDGAEFVVFTDPSRRYVDCTDGVCRLLGYQWSRGLWVTVFRTVVSGSIADHVAHRRAAALRCGALRSYINGELYVAGGGVMAKQLSQAGFSVVVLAPVSRSELRECSDAA